MRECEKGKREGGPSEEWVHLPKASRALHCERERERKNEQGPERTERFSVTLRNERGQGLSDTRERMAHSASSMDRCHSTGALLSI